VVVGNTKPKPILARTGFQSAVPAASYYLPKPEGEAEEPQDEEMEQVPGMDEEKDSRRSKLHRKHV
jgi:hypothetical protein